MGSINLLKLFAYVRRNIIFADFPSFVAAFQTYPHSTLGCPPSPEVTFQIAVREESKESHVYNLYEIQPIVATSVLYDNCLLLGSEG